MALKSGDRTKLTATGSHVWQVARLLFEQRMMTSGRAYTNNPQMLGPKPSADSNSAAAYRPAMLAHQIRGVFAMPVVVAGEYVGALDLFRAQPGRLAGEQFTGAIAAADLASIPLLDILDADMQAAVAEPDSNAWVELNVLSRMEVSQATGMLVAQLEVEPAEALVRLRARAYATGRSASDVARDILDRRLKLDAD